MSTEIVQVRDVASEDAQILRARAKARNMSLSSYLRELIHDDASQPVMAEILARIASRERIEVGTEEIRSFIEDGRH
ncbi:MULTISPECIES: hypothetical protein [unclassified Pseudactinotalea]|uniref:hypothetical protein n=1 Tax=unclassified Pseudactinotalea TaxID=2649176 RepID=UPI00128D0731|nr:MULTISPECIES: hypothetical protein [unclassified Pseudactinotalea]MPV51261.1 hypothetical protein [Pseudactinotalea sp. HY160]QGH69657.1 hypothetical protein GCE65_09150 [Pseudactinotalea sp. HY158]